MQMLKFNIRSIDDICPKYIPIWYKNDYKKNKSHGLIIEKRKKIIFYFPIIKVILK